MAGGSATLQGTARARHAPRACVRNDWEPAGHSDRRLGFAPPPPGPTADDLPPLVLPPISYPQVLAPCADAININDKITQIYVNDIVPGTAGTRRAGGRGLCKGALHLTASSLLACSFLGTFAAWLATCNRNMRVVVGAVLPMHHDSCLVWPAHLPTHLHSAQRPEPVGCGVRGPPAASPLPSAWPRRPCYLPTPSKHTLARAHARRPDV